MKDKIFCRYEKKEVNIQYYLCLNEFVNCGKCPKLRPRLGTLQPAKPIRKISSNLDNNKSKREPFSDWNTYPVEIILIEDPKTGAMALKDFIFVLENSALLDFLIETYKREAKEDRDKGLEAFWRKVESFSRWRQGEWECLTEEEKSILQSARGGSVEALQKLVVANPRMVHLPFVADKIENLIRAIKFGDGKEIKKARKQWQGFLPKRSNHKAILRDEHLAGVLKMIVTMTKANKKKEAVEILLDHDPSIGEERLRKISIGMGDKK